MTLKSHACSGPTGDLEESGSPFAAGPGEGGKGALVAAALQHRDVVFVEDRE